MNSPVRDIGFLMDSWESLNLATETSLLCMDELIARGHRVYWLEPFDLSLDRTGVTGGAVAVTAVDPFEREYGTRLDVNALDALVIRKDPPFDRTYLHLTYLLDFLDPGVVQVNSPRALRNVNEKLFTLNWGQYCPDTLVSADVRRLGAFARRHGKIVLKPLDDCSGRGIRFVRHSDHDLQSQLETMIRENGYVMAQQFLNGVARGDKRVYLVNGEPVGWVNRIPVPGSDLANIHQGAVCSVTELSDRERDISLVVGAELVDEGILLAGLDFIDGRLTETNVTSPSAVRQINEVDGGHLERLIVDGMLDHIARHREQAGLAGAPI